MVLILALGTAGVLAVTASAALFLTFSTTRAAPGTVVTARTGGSGALAGVRSSGRPLRVFLISADELDRNAPDIGVTSPADTRLIPIGDLRVDAEGNGTLRFTVPEIPSGEYTTVIHCVPCAASSGGREFLATGPFPEPFVVLHGDASGDTVSVRAVVLGVAGALLLLAVALGSWRAARSR